MMTSSERNVWGGGGVKYIKEEDNCDVLFTLEFNNSIGKYFKYLILYIPMQPFPVTLAL